MYILHKHQLTDILTSKKIHIFQYYFFIHSIHTTGIYKTSFRYFLNTNFT